MNDGCVVLPLQGRAGLFPGWIHLHQICMTPGGHMRCMTAPLQLRGDPFRTPLVCPQSLHAQLPVKHPRRQVVSNFLSFLFLVLPYWVFSDFSGSNLVLQAGFELDSKKVTISNRWGYGLYRCKQAIFSLKAGFWQIPPWIWV